MPADQIMDNKQTPKEPSKKDKFFALVRQYGPLILRTIIKIAILKIVDHYW
jgi:hypothetical protein